MLILAALAVAVFVVAPTVGAAEKAAKPEATAAPAASMAQEEVTATGTIVEAKNAEGKVSGCMLEQADGQSMMLSEAQDGAAILSGKG